MMTPSARPSAASSAMSFSGLPSTTCRSAWAPGATQPSLPSHAQNPGADAGGGAQDLDRRQHLGAEREFRALPALLRPEQVRAQTHLHAGVAHMFEPAQDEGKHRLHLGEADRRQAQRLAGLHHRETDREGRDRVGAASGKQGRGLRIDHGRVLDRAHAELGAGGGSRWSDGNAPSHRRRDARIPRPRSRSRHW